MTAPPSANEEYFRLRAEWLRFKNHVIDSNTGLPTLVAVLDDVRRLMEERGTLGLVYLDLGADGHIEPVHGWQAFDELLRGSRVRWPRCARPATSARATSWPS